MSRVLFLSLLLLPGIALAAPRTFKELADFTLVYINAGIGVALIAGITIYFFGVSTSMFKIMKGEPDTMRQHLLWGIIALFVMFSVWGIVALLRNTLFGTGGYSIGNESGGTECANFNDCMIGGESGGSTN